MEITAVTKFKLGAIHKLLRKLGWSQAELARRIGTNQSYVSSFMTLRHRPGAEMATRIQNAFAEVGEYIDVTSVWPESFKGFANPPIVEETQDILPEQLMGISFSMIEDKEFTDDEIQEAMSKLTEREKFVVEHRIMGGLTLDQTASKMGIQSRERIRQIENTAKEKLKAELFGNTNVENYVEYFKRKVATDKKSLVALAAPIH